MMQSLLQELIRIPSPSRGEAAAADFLESYLNNLQLNPSREGNNLWCSCGQGDYTILLNAHIDTVPPCEGWTCNPYGGNVTADGKIMGLGANDDGASLVSLLAAFVHLSKAGLPYRLIFSATAEEEVSGAGGLDMLLPLLGKVDCAVIGEPTGMKMAVAERGLMVLDCTAHGVAVHAARPGGVNAIYKAMEDIAYLQTFKFPKVSPLLGPVGLNVTQINAGKAHNVIPDECSFVVDVRSNECYTNPEILEIIKASLASDVKARSTRLESSSIPLNHRLVKTGEALGLEITGSPTLSNCAVCPFPTLKIGPGESARSHKADEYVLVSELEAAKDLYIKLLSI